MIINCKVTPESEVCDRAEGLITGPAEGDTHIIHTRTQGKHKAASVSPSDARAAGPPQFPVQHRHKRQEHRA